MEQIDSSNRFNNFRGTVDHPLSRG